ncbi:hypothetical protein [Streptosporangium sp. NPDC000509]|uniref:hypothetical protein n=1 Tax=Streptosporangium sp. NPDC000509 TaxID=3366186 RepID=UPI0036834036
MVPRGPARHRKDEWDGESGGLVPRSPVRDSRSYLDSRPFSMPPPPGPWRRPWSRLSRDHLLRPALIAGFLAAAGVGVWSSGWSPWDGVPTAGTSPASSGEGVLLGHDMVITASRAPGVDAKTPPGAREGDEGGDAKVPRGRASEGGARPDTKGPRGGDRREGKRPGHERAGAAGGGNGKVSAPAPVGVLPVDRASSARDARNEWVERVERAGAAKKPAERHARHREGDSARAAAGAETGRAKEGAGQESGRGAASKAGAGRGNASGGRGDGSAGRRAGNARDAGETAGRSRSGAREDGAQPRAGRTGAPATGSPPPSASRSRPSPGGGISAGYACRHLASTDWRHAYCVQVWNDYRNRKGLR